LAHVDAIAAADQQDDARRGCVAGCALELLVRAAGLRRAGLEAAVRLQFAGDRTTHDPCEDDEAEEDAERAPGARRRDISKSFDHAAIVASEDRAHICPGM
jgi:hypothetical protein